MKELRLEFGQLSSLYAHEMIKLGKAFQNLRNSLEILTLINDCNEIKSEGIRELSYGISVCEQLKFLNLSLNNS